MREGRPRGAPGRRRALHGGRAGHDRPRRLAAERVPHARAAAVLRRHLLPARAAPRDARVDAGAAGDRRVLERAQRGDPRRAASGCASGCPAARCCSPPPSRSAPSALEAAVARLRESFDARNGGFGGAPKFPQASVIEFLLLRGEREMAPRDAARDGRRRHPRPARRRLRPLQRRRDLDGAALREDALRQRAARPRLPARLAGLRRARACSRSACDTLDWALREMRGPEGGFYSALDADSEGVEGRFYVWTLAELRELLGEDADAAIAWLGATEQGNFADPHHPQPGLNVLQDRGRASRRRSTRPTRERIRARLLAGARDARAPGARRQAPDSWNALMICALAGARAPQLARRAPCRGAWTRTGRALLDAASGCAEFVLASCATSADGCCAPTTTGRRRSTPTWRTTPSCSRR